MTSRPSIISRPGKPWPTPSTSDSSSRSCCLAMARSRTARCRRHCNGLITPMCRNEYDVAKANQLLDEAGYPRGPGGICFRTRIYGNPGVRAILSEILKEQFKAVGIAAEVVIQEWASYAHAIRNTRDIDGVFTIFSLQ